jgi:hypothetical protein
LILQTIGVDVKISPDRQCFPENLFGHT